MYNEYNRYDDYDHHIRDERMYRDAVSHLRWNNGKGNGERWKIEDLMNSNDIDFNQERFTPYDYAYMVNANYADYGKLSDKSDYYKQMAKDDLHNDSFPERGEERAYYDAMRRSNRYYNRYDEPVRYEYNNRYNYGNTYGYSNRRYNERSYDGRADRDNDGRYNEGR